MQSPLYQLTETLNSRINRRQSKDKTSDLETWDTCIYINRDVRVCVQYVWLVLLHSLTASTGMPNGLRQAHWELMEIVFKNQNRGAYKRAKKNGWIFLKITFTVTNENDPLRVKRRASTEKYKAAYRTLSWALDSKSHVNQKEQSKSESTLLASGNFSFHT